MGAVGNQNVQHSLLAQELRQNDIQIAIPMEGRPVERRRPQPEPRDLRQFIQRTFAAEPFVNPLLVPSGELLVAQDQLEVQRPAGMVAQDFELGDVVFGLTAGTSGVLVDCTSGGVNFSQSTTVPPNPGRYYTEHGYGDLVLYRLWARQK